MTKRQRTLLFLLLLGLFLILAPSLTLYSQGYRIDIQQKRITQTGAFYFKIAPARADIIVDGTHIKRTDFLFGSALTKNFFPGSYFLEITKEGYHSWQKILDIKEQQVTEAKNILLFKKNPAFQKLADKVERFWVSPNKQYALLLQREPKTSWQLNLLNLETGGKESLMVGASSKDEIVDIQWAKDSRRFLLHSTRGEQLVSEIHNVSANQPCFKAPCSLEYLNQGIGNIQFSPATLNQVLFTRFLNTTKALFMAQYREQKSAVPIANNVVAFTSHSTYVFWLDNDGTLWQKNLDADSEAQVFQESVFTPKRETTYELLIAGDAILIKEDTALFLHERSVSERREVLSPVLEIAVGPGGAKVALRNQSELWVLFLKEETEQPQHQAGELVLLTRFSEPPQQLSWIDSSYLLFSLGETIRGAEIDTRDRLNVVDLITFSDHEFFWNNEKGILYILSEDTFFVSEKVVR
ncbi:hypothetical protein IH982_00775 [Patescibacteria group bacterium]|nr:hypothetical protein [Patescibacteria group bacterium]